MVEKSLRVVEKKLAVNREKLQCSLKSKKAHKLWRRSLQ
jgi:hypothetical protein